MPKILIVEDEILIADYIKELLEEQKFDQIMQAHSVAEAMAQLNDFDPDIVLMDINLEGNSEGIALAQNEFKDKSIIFLTAQNDPNTINKAVATNPESYLTKPIKITDLLIAIQLAVAKNQLKFITLKDGHNDVKINFDDILYLKSDKNYIDIVTKLKKFALRYTLSEMIVLLPSEKFLQIQRSIIINKDHIEKKSASSVQIAGVELPFSRKFLK